MDALNFKELTEFMSRYTNWLWTMLGFDRRYSKLFNVLYNEEFTWVIPMDENRATNGIYLRDRFAYEQGEILPANWRDWPCSVLEMLASLAFTMEESFLYDPSSDTDTDTWFWEMLTNLGLDIYTDTYIRANPIRSEVDIKHILRVFLERKYDTDGTGGAFPLDDPFEDQRDVELWHQMNAYVVEKLALS